jgi:hypothetical protein
VLHKALPPNPAHFGVGGRLLGSGPTGDVEQDSVSCDVVLDADVEGLAGRVEEAAGPLGRQVVEGGEAGCRSRVAVSEPTRVSGLYLTGRE